MLMVMDSAADKALSASQVADVFIPNRDWWERLFSAIDSGNAAQFVESLTPDAQFRFANAPATIGRQNIRIAVSAFFEAIKSSKHRLLEMWNANESVGCEGEVTYTRLDGSVVTIPFANVFKLRGEKIASYHIYIDNSSLFAASG
jgi:ketosteroid isomerase-like protein